MPRKSPSTRPVSVPGPNPGPVATIAPGQHAYALLLLALRRLRYEDDVRILAALPGEIARRVTSAHGRRHRTHWIRLFNRPTEDGFLVAAVLAPISHYQTPLLLLNIEALAEMVTWRPALLLNLLSACAVAHEMAEALASRPVFVSNDPRSQRRWEVIHHKALIRQERARTAW